MCVCAYVLAVPHELSLRTQCQHVLLGFDVLHELLERKQSLQAGVHVADHIDVWESDAKMHSHISIMVFNDRSFSVSLFLVVICVITGCRRFLPK